MTTPTVIFDFTTRTVGIVGLNADADRKLQAALAIQRDIEVSSGGIPPEQHEQ